MVQMGCVLQVYHYGSDTALAANFKTDMAEELDGRSNLFEKAADTDPRSQQVDKLLRWLAETYAWLLPNEILLR